MKSQEKEARPVLVSLLLKPVDENQNSTAEFQARQFMPKLVQYRPNLRGLRILIRPVVPAEREILIDQ